MKATKRLSRSLALFVTGAALTLAGTVFGSAEADGVSGTLSGTGSGQQVNSGGGSHWAGLIYLAIDGGTIDTYCIDLGTSTSAGVHYEEGSWSEANVSNLGMVRWVLRHGYPNVSLADLATASGLSGLADNPAAAGTQAAIWYFSDGVSLTGSNDPDAVAVYNYLITSASSDPEPAASLSISPVSLTGTIGELVGPFTVATSAATVTLTATGGVVTDSTGTPIATIGNGGTFYITTDTVGTVMVDASATATLSSGRVFLSTDQGPKQKLILASTTTSKTAVSVTVGAENTTTTSSSATTTTEAVTTTTEAATTTTAAVTTTTQPSATTTPVATTTAVASEGPTTTAVEADRGTLPHTGVSSMSLVVRAAGIMLMGMPLVMYARRHEA